MFFDYLSKIIRIAAMKLRFHPPHAGALTHLEELNWAAENAEDPGPLHVLAERERRNAGIPLTRFLCKQRLGTVFDDTGERRNRRQKSS